MCKKLGARTGTGVAIPTRAKEDLKMADSYEILDDIRLPPARAVAARQKKSDLGPNQQGKETSREGTRFDNISDKFRRLFCTPSLANGEDPDVYAELFRCVEEVVQPKNVWDQMDVADITNHVWEHQRCRRCTGTVINSKRRPALKKILHGAIGLSDVDTETVSDIYFGVERLEERDVTDYSTQVEIPKTRAGILDLMEKHGFVEADIDRLAMETSLGSLADLENLALKHEIRRERILRELERRRKKRNEKSHRADRRQNGKARAELPEEPSPSPTELPP
jgi:hypothetical protein